MLRFFDFTRWWPPPFWIFKFVKRYWLTVSEGHRRITVPNFVKIGRSVAKLLRFFLILKMAAAAILDFWNREILLIIRMQSVETNLHAKFCQNRSIGCEDIKIFRFFKMATHSEYLWVTITLQNLVMFDAVVFIIWTFQYFTRLAGKCLFTPEK